MRHYISILAAAISLMVFSCSESPSSSTGVSSVSSSSTLDITGRACQYSGEWLGINEFFACAEAPVGHANLQKFKTECEEEEEDGTWVDDCPSGETTVCRDDSDEDLKDVQIKLYVDDFSCGDFGFKNADGSTDIVPQGGACGPIESDMEGAALLICVEIPNISTALAKILCASEGLPFVTECPLDADLVCYNPEEKIIPHYYGEAMKQYTCSQIGMEDLQISSFN